MAEPLQVRPATGADVAAIREIYAPAVLHGSATFETELPNEAEMLLRMEGVQGKGLPYLVAVAGGKVAGYAYATRFRDRHAYRFTLEDSVYVAPDRQGRGIGRALLGELIPRCEELGYRQMIAAIGDSQNAGSIALHARCGFVMAGSYRSVGFKHGRWIDVVLMQRALGEGDGSLPAG